VVKKVVTIMGIKHCGSDSEARGQAQTEAIAWFDQHLKAWLQIASSPGSHA
jgi:hypothetical protein